MMRTEHVAFVLGLSDTGLGAIRSLGRMGIPVIGLDVDPHMPGFRSRFCTARPCPDPVHQPEELVRFLLDEGQRLDRPGILFPTSDAFVLFLSRYRHDLRTCFRLALAPARVVEAIVNKRLQYDLAEQVGLPYPRTFYPQTMEEVYDIKDRVEYPVFIKPYYGHLWRERFAGTHKGFKVEIPGELMERFREVFSLGLQAMVQSIVPGPNTNHFKVSAYIHHSGQPLAAFTLRKIRQYPTEFGVGTVVESLYLPELIERGLYFLRSIGYQGIGSIEFKRDERDGGLKMIELNPRLWQQNIHATVCGMNFPLLQYLDLTGQHPERLSRFREGVKWLDGVSDFQAFWDYFRRRELSPWTWLRSWMGTRAFATFAWDDLGPFLQANTYGLRYLRLHSYILRNAGRGGSVDSTRVLPIPSGGRWSHVRCSWRDRSGTAIHAQISH